MSLPERLVKEAQKDLKRLYSDRSSVRWEIEFATKNKKGSLAMNQVTKRNLEALEKFLEQAIEDVTSLKENLVQARGRLRNLKECLNLS